MLADLTSETGKLGMCMALRAMATDCLAQMMKAGPIGPGRSKPVGSAGCIKNRHEASAGSPKMKEMTHEPSLVISIWGSQMVHLRKPPDDSLPEPATPETPEDLIT